MQASRLQSGYSQLSGLCIDLVARTNCSFFHKCRCWSLLHFKHSHVRTTLLCTEHKRREKILSFTVMRPVAGRNISLAETQEKCHACWTLLEVTVSEYPRLSRVNNRIWQLVYRCIFWWRMELGVSWVIDDMAWALIFPEKLTRYISTFFFSFLTVLEAWH